MKACFYLFISLNVCMIFATDPTDECVPHAPHYCCEPGKFLVFASTEPFNLRHECRDCPAGTYQPDRIISENGAEDHAFCKQCPANTESPTGSTSLSACTFSLEGNFFVCSVLRGDLQIPMERIKDDLYGSEAACDIDKTLNPEALNEWKTKYAGFWSEGDFVFISTNKIGSKELNIVFSNGGVSFATDRPATENNPLQWTIRSHSTWDSRNYFPTTTQSDFTYRIDDTWSITTTNIETLTITIDTTNIWTFGQSVDMFDISSLQVCWRNN